MIWLLRDISNNGSLVRLELLWKELLLNADELELLDREVALLEAIEILDEYIAEPAETAELLEELLELLNELIDKVELFDIELKDKLEVADKPGEEPLPPQAYSEVIHKIHNNLIKQKCKLIVLIPKNHHIIIREKLVCHPDSSISYYLRFKYE